MQYINTSDLNYELWTMTLADAEALSPNKPI